MWMESMVSPQTGHISAIWHGGSLGGLSDQHIDYLIGFDLSSSDRQEPPRWEHGITIANGGAEKKYPKRSHIWSLGRFTQGTVRGEKILKKKNYEKTFQRPKIITIHTPLSTYLRSSAAAAGGLPLPRMAANQRLQQSQRVMSHHVTAEASDWLQRSCAILNLQVVPGRKWERTGGSGPPAAGGKQKKYRLFFFFEPDKTGFRRHGTVRVPNF